MYGSNPEKVIERWDSLPEILRDAMTSDGVANEQEKIYSDFHLSDQKQVLLGKLIRGVFFGFIHLQDLYKEIRDTLGVDGRLALEIYQEVDKKIFLPLHGEIEKNYLAHKVGVVDSSQVSEPAVSREKVVLKSGEKDVVDLRSQKGSLPTAAPIRIVGKEEEARAVASPIVSKPIFQKEDPSVQSFAPSPSPVAPPSAPQEKTSEQKFSSSPSSPAQHGPLIIHKKDSFEPLVGRSSDPYKQMSFGGFMGAFKSMDSKKEASPSKATVEIPGMEKKESSDSGAGKVPVSVKHYTQEPRTVHYSDFRTPLEGGEKEQPQEKDKESGMIDLNNMTFRQ